MTIFKIHYSFIETYGLAEGKREFDFGMIRNTRSLVVWSLVVHTEVFHTEVVHIEFAYQWR